MQQYGVGLIPLQHQYRGFLRLTQGEGGVLLQLSDVVGVHDRGTIDGVLPNVVHVWGRDTMHSLCARFAFFKRAWGSRLHWVMGLWFLDALIGPLLA
ncbi:hypothetical protein JCM17961_30610 [Endothiovibrio diazotrophicus]